MRKFLSHWFGTKTPPSSTVASNYTPFSPTPLRMEKDKIAGEQFSTALNKLGVLEQTDLCHKCGGLFDKSYLTSTLEATFVIDNQGNLISGSSIAPPPQFHLQFFCQRCKGDAQIIFKLQYQEGQTVEDVKSFDLSDGYFNELDEAGKQRVSITMDSYVYLFCEQCGERITRMTKCAGCRKKKEEG